jgi:hypothetical protein
MVNNEIAPATSSGGAPPELAEADGGAHGQRKHQERIGRQAGIAAGWPDGLPFWDASFGIKRRKYA